MILALICHEAWDPPRVALHVGSEVKEELGAWRVTAGIGLPGLY